MAIKIIEDIKSMLPKDADISAISLEGANIVLYTKNKEFFLENNNLIQGIVSTIKKRVELRIDPSLALEIEKAEEKIKEIIKEEAGKLNIIFDQQRSQVIIESEKPGIAIGKSGENLKEIKRKTLWVPYVRRIPAIKAKLLENIRQVLYENNDYRKKFLNTVGERIYGSRRKERHTEWIRIACLGASRQVGRSCFLLQTEESNVLLDCGIDVAAQGEDQYPFFGAPEFRINELDAVVISHPHLDHCGLVPLLFKYGYKGPVYCTEPTRDIAALLCLDLLEIGKKDAKNGLYSSTDIKEAVKHTISLNFEEVTDITPDIRLTFYNAGHNLGSAMCHFNIGEGLHNFLYTGDMNYELSNLLAPSSTKFPRLETVMIESTYGGKNDVLATRKESEDYLINIIKNTVARGGKVLLPVLGVGRSQEIMVILEKAMSEERLEKIPIFLQGMIWEVNAIHTAYPDFFANKIKNSIFHKGENPFLSPIFKEIAGRKEMAQVLEEQGPCIVMATSGMMSVDANEPILVKNSNQLKTVKVGDIINKTINESNKVGYLVGESEGKMAIPTNNLQVPCYDFNTGKMEFKPVSVVIKHKIKEPIYKIKLKSGRETSVTGAHSVMVLKNGFITSKKVKDLTDDDYIVINKKISTNNTEVSKKLDLFKILLDNTPSDILSKIYIKKDDNANHYTSWGKKYRTSSLLNYNKNAKLAKNARIGLKAATGLEIPYMIKINKELCRLIGYFVSEGCYYTSKFRCGDVKLSFGIHEKELAEDAAECIKKCFGIKPKIIEDKNKSALTVQFGSKLFAYIFKYALKCKTGAGKKRIPSLIFNTRDGLKKEFLKGYFLGDGSLYNKKNKVAVSFVSKSKKLMSDLSLLLSTLEIPSHKIEKVLKNKRIIKDKEVKDSVLYRLSITNPKYINKLKLLNYKVNSKRSFVERIPFSVPVEEIKIILKGLKLNEDLKKLKWSIWKRKRITYKRLKEIVDKVEVLSKNKELINSIKNISKGYLGFDKIAKIEKTKASDGYVYDFSIDGVENFLAGHGGILLHNTGGASVEYFKNLADDPKNSIVLTSYQGEGTLGRKLQQGEKEIMFKEDNRQYPIKVKLEVYSIHGFTGHSDRNQLMNFIRRLSPKPKKVITIHGEASKTIDLASSIYKSEHIETVAPKNLEIVRLR